MRRAAGQRRPRSASRRPAAGTPRCRRGSRLSPGSRRPSVQRGSAEVGELLGAVRRPGRRRRPPPRTAGRSCRPGPTGTSVSKNGAGQTAGEHLRRGRTSGSGARGSPERRRRPGWSRGRARRAPGEGEPGRPYPHQVVAAGRGRGLGRAAGERPRAAPEQPAVAGVVPALGGRAAQSRIRASLTLVNRVAKQQHPGVPLRVHGRRRCAARSNQVSPGSVTQSAAPSTARPRPVDRTAVKRWPHGTVVGQLDVALVAHVGRAAPEVRLGRRWAARGRCPCATRGRGAGRG